MHFLGYFIFVLPNLAIDESLYLYRGRIRIKQYNPSKPAKYGLLHSRGYLCNSTIEYTYFTLPYVGKRNNVWSNKVSTFYVSGTDKYTKYLVTETSKYNKLKGTDISMDRYFTTSVSVAKWALDVQSVTIVGTMRHDRRELPEELKC